jgi:hypothetical protein
MRKALANVAETPAGDKHPLVIGGQRIATAKWMDSINPSHKRRIVGRCRFGDGGECAAGDRGGEGGVWELAKTAGDRAGQAPCKGR